MRIRNIVLVATAGVVTAVAVAAVALGGMRGLSARAEPSIAERALARVVRAWMTPRAVRDTQNPVPFTDGGWIEARMHFADHCAMCRANDGSGATEMGRNMYPKAPDMRLAETQRLTDGELYWIIENGVRLTGMPAWGTGDGNDSETWNLVHFIRRLKDLTPEQLEEMEGMNPRNPLELKEELDNQRFLAGEDVDPAAPTHHH